MDEEKRLAWAQFRFEVIAPLVCRRLEDCDRRQLKREILSTLHRSPDGVEKRVAERTLRSWLARYQLHGIDGLKRMTPPGKGTYRAIPGAVLDKAEELRRELPTRSIKTILSLMRAQNIDTSGIAKSTLNFHLNLRGAPKEKNASEKGTFQRFQKDHANDLWQADSSGGIWLPDPLNRARPKQTKFISFIDDATRVVLHAQFYFDEQLPSLIDCLRKALLSRGKPHTIYCDNGPVYISKGLARTCSQLGVELLHAKEFFPEGKGKIERHIGTVKSGFYSEAKHCGLTSLDQLNTFFFAWLEKEYHATIHSELKMTPFQRWQQDEEKGFVELITAEKIRRALMLREERRVNRRTGTVSLNNRIYRAGKEFAGKKVEIFWEADKLQPSVEIWYDGKFVDIAHELIPGKDIDFALRPERDRHKGPPRVLDSSKKYQQSLVADYQQAPIPRGSYLAEVEFHELVGKSLGREISSEEKEFLSTVYQELSPLPDTVTEEILTKAVNAKGDQRHLRYYCDLLKQSIFQRRKHP